MKEEDKKTYIRKKTTKKQKLEIGKFLHKNLLAIFVKDLIFSQTVQKNSYAFKIQSSNTMMNPILILLTEEKKMTENQKNHTAFE